MTFRLQITSRSEISWSVLMIIFKWKFKSIKKIISQLGWHILACWDHCRSAPWLFNVYNVSWDIYVNFHKGLTLLEVLIFFLHHHLATSNAAVERKRSSFLNLPKATEEPTNSNESFGLNSQFSHNLVIAFSFKLGTSLARKCWRGLVSWYLGCALK